MGKLRWTISYLLGLGILISSADRITLSVSGDALQHTFGLDKAGFGLLTGAFSIMYAVCQIPIGLLLDRYGVALVGRVATFTLGLTCLFGAIAPNLPCLFIARGTLGLAECSGFLRSAKAIGYWFPTHERGMATAFFETMVNTANVIAFPLEAFLVIRYGWRNTFIINAIVSFAYFVAYFFLYRDPSKHPMLSAEEHEYIVQGGSRPEGTETSINLRCRLAHFLRQPKVWGLTIGLSSYGYGFGMLSAWLPTYLESSFRIPLMQASLYATIPWIAATTCGFLIGGKLVDDLIVRGYSMTNVRKTIMSAGLMLGTTFIAASFTHDMRISLFYLAIAMGGLAFHGTVAWTIPGLIAPKGQIGIIGGIMNTFMNLTAFIAQVLTGFIVTWTGSFAVALMIAGIIPIIGIISYVTLLGEIEPLPDILIRS